MSRAATGGIPPAPDPPTNVVLSCPQCHILEIVKCAFYSLLYSLAEDFLGGKLARLHRVRKAF
jgi:hypothetical protein